MTGGVVPPPQKGDPAPPEPSLSTTPAEPTDVECPICYQEYNQYNKCPRMLDCLHVFCTECLQRIQLCPSEPLDPGSTPAIPCPLCRHLTPLETGDALSLPCNSRILARLPPVAFRLPVAMAARLATVTQRVVLSLEGDGRDARFIILPTVSLRVQQMHPEAVPCGPYGAASGLAGDEEVLQQSKKTLFCVQLLAVTFWVLFVVTCVSVVVFGPHFLKRKL
ncbi:RING finger domain-containing protein [Pseudoliparis swirei]|uniref:RING finger domain-containing protein n=1 Tax=Pseudoliparis swirei TaxID=2059687 RepID=UPI0024BE06AB|nr:RING finger domain-containing protein [Pseudoliparis swirei]XP_056299085.1 RING finger domain-containing protein [Pseudoliparis swirei]XP_056299086.1 RING finger domain-containing protein [Pseudoliparis swirei]XP_056299087.1 RING finger domain-containing protein [Pseudoliparis swirei]XP_056299088.1 RING finger domain-containing protein [Pseudoliparis swirei]XP_056299089.1 RING finger domain-containing protein [Pseudoliparis swirei]